MSEFDRDAVDGIAELARSAAKATTCNINDPRTGKNVPVAQVVDADGSVKFESVKSLLDVYLTVPERRAGTAKVFTLQDFNDLVNRHKDNDSAVFGSINPPKLLGVIDYHRITGATAAGVVGDGRARFGKHLIQYDFPLTDPAKTWAGGNKRPMSQGDFALFIEDNIADLSSPLDGEAKMYEKLFHTKFASPAEMLTLSRGLAVQVKGKIAEAVVAQSGEVEMTFTEEHQNAAGKKLTVPGLFMLSYPIFDGDAAERVCARLRYRVSEGRVTWFYALYRYDETLRTAVMRNVNTAKEKTALPTFLGTPEA